MSQSSKNLKAAVFSDMDPTIMCPVLSVCVLTVSERTELQRSANYIMNSSVKGFFVLC